MEGRIAEKDTALREALRREAAARDELERVKARLEELSRRRDEFISMVAHDVAAPLSTIRGYAELLARPTHDADLRERACATIIAETERVGRLAADLVDASLVAAGRFRIRPSRCDLVAIAREQVELANAQAGRCAIQVEAMSAVEAECDRDRLVQVLSNLLTNAIKYAGAGRICVRLWREGDQARLSVADEGPGIAPTDLGAIFEVGRRLEGDAPSARQGGAGLGLHIARGIVEAHGGRIWAESAPGRGATFHLALPTTAAARNEGELGAYCASP